MDFLFTLRLAIFCALAASTAAAPLQEGEFDCYLLDTHEYSRRDAGREVLAKRKEMMGCPVMPNCK